MKGSSRRRSWIRRQLPILLVGGGALLAWYVVPRVLFLLAAIILFPVSSFDTWLTESTASLPSYLRDRGVLIEEMRSLENDLVAATGDQFTMRALESENDTLRQLLGDDGEERVMAGVIARPPHLPYDVLLLDQGSDDGVLVGAPVYSSDRTVIGYIGTVTKQYAVVTLITSPSFRSTVYLIGPDIFTTAEEVGGGQLRIGVPQGVPVEVGDLAVVPSVSTGVYGTVHHIERTPTQPEQYAYVAPQTTLASLRLVSVGTTPLVATTFAEARQNVEAVLSDRFIIPVPEGELIDLGVGSSTAATSTEMATSSQSAEAVQ